jgi:hypothetical protein
MLALGRCGQSGEIAAEIRPFPVGTRAGSRFLARYVVLNPPRPKIVRRPELHSARSVREENASLGRRQTALTEFSRATSRAQACVIRVYRRRSAQ